MFLLSFSVIKASQFCHTEIILNFWGLLKEIEEISIFPHFN